MSEVITNWVLFDATADKPYIKKMMPEGFLAFFESEEDAKRAKASIKGTDYKRIDRVLASDYDKLKAENEELYHAELCSRASLISLYKQLDKARELLKYAADECIPSLGREIDAWLEANK